VKPRFLRGDACHNLLADVEAARDLDHDALDRRRRVLGQDRPDTLASAASLATDLRALGEADDAP
jgi:hypothetical protein